MSLTVGPCGNLVAAEGPKAFLFLTQGRDDGQTQCASGGQANRQGNEEQHDEGRRKTGGPRVELDSIRNTLQKNRGETSGDEADTETYARGRQCVR